MKNKIIKKTLILTMVLILSSTALVSGIQSLKNNTSDKTIFTNNQINTKISHKYGYEQFLAGTYNLMDRPISLESQKSKKNQLIIEPIETPDEFCWVNVDGKDWTTRAKNQGNCGSCWLFSAMGAFESIINIRENCAKLNPDLSEQFVLSCLPEAGSCNGGNVENCVYYYIMNTSEFGYNCNGVITEEIFSYESSFNYIPPCSDKPPEWANYLVPILDYNESWPDLEDPILKDTIKTLIYEKGPLMMYFWASDRFIRWGGYHKDSTDYYPNYNENTPYYVNHGMTMVGWKDDPSIGNGGYWICKNTWGPNWGYKGFVNVEYDTLNVGGFIAWVDYDPETYDWPPVADIDRFYYASSGEEISFDASSSVDAEGEITEYVWDFGNNQTKNGPTTTFTYDEPGVYPIKLTVYDSIGQGNSQIALVCVDSDPLQLEISGGNGISIDFNNPVDMEILEWEYDINIPGIVVPKKVSGLYETVPALGRVETDISLFGIGFGQLQITIENFSLTKNILILGPFVKVFNREL